jgi:hypothetical protein
MNQPARIIYANSLGIVVLGITFLASLMRTVGEIIGTSQRTLSEWSTSDHQARAQLPITAHAAPKAPSKSLTYANTA